MTSPSEKPILMSGPLVVKTMAGLKTNTRRVLDPARLRVRLPYEVKSDFAHLLPEHAKVRARGIRRAQMNKNGAVSVETSGGWLGVKPGEFDFCCPYVVGTTRLVNDRWHIEPHGSQQLWVRESMRLVEHDEDQNGLCDVDTAEYMADGAVVENLDNWPWKRNRLPSIHMPRGLCRLVLQVTQVRIEHLQDISEEDAKAEGVDRIKGGGGALYPSGQAARADSSYRDAFRKLWDQINGKREGCAWADNPWVWAIAYKCMEVARG